MYYWLCENKATGDLNIHIRTRLNSMPDPSNARTALLASFFLRNPPALCRFESAVQWAVKPHKRVSPYRRRQWPKVLGKGAFLKDEILRARSDGRILRMPLAEDYRQPGTPRACKKNVAAELFIDVSECAEYDTGRL